MLLVAVRPSGQRSAECPLQNHLAMVSTAEALDAHRLCLANATLAAPCDGLSGEHAACGSPPSGVAGGATFYLLQLLASAT